MNPKSESKTHVPKATSRWRRERNEKRKRKVVGVFVITWKLKAICKNQCGMKNEDDMGVNDNCERCI